MPKILWLIKTFGGQNVIYLSSTSQANLLSFLPEEKLKKDK